MTEKTETEAKEKKEGTVHVIVSAVFTFNVWFSLPYAIRFQTISLSVSN